MFKKYFGLVVITFFVLMVGCGNQKKTITAQSTKSSQPEFTAVVETMDSIYIASLSKMGPYTEVGKSLGELMDWLGKNNVMPMGAPFGIYYDDPSKIPSESTKYEVCFPVPSGTKGNKQVMVKKFGPVQVAATIYTGPYDKVGTVYTKLIEWIINNKFEVTGPAHEFYLNDPSKVIAESLKTKIAFPIKSVAEQPAGIKN